MVTTTAGTLLATAIIMAAFTLRPAVTSLASILGDVRTALGATAAWSSLIAAAPTICFGLAGFAAPWVDRKLGTTRALLAALTLIAAGLFARVAAGPSLLLIATFALCGGIAVCNVLLPVMIKEYFPNQVGRLTGLFSASLAFSASMGAATTPAVQNLGGWRVALGVWALPGILAIALWWNATRKLNVVKAEATQTPGEHRSLVRNAKAWYITIFFALQAGFSYTTMAWLSEVLTHTAGVDRTTAGIMFGITMLIGVPISLTVPAIAARQRNPYGWVVLLTAMSMIGTLGLMLAPATLTGLWLLFVGAGIGIFPLGVAFISIRTRTPADTVRMSAMAQSLGYLLAAIGPFLFGLLREMTGGFTASHIAVLGFLSLQMVFGTLAARPRFV
ncbi:MFS transporter [Pseudonocardiaceae bacterium YIM PH 21723]|nr:MFS transporter [Pseudonocardiaceae bacterium YIM PH 21723]